MESKIKKMYFQDCAVVLTFTSILWILLVYVMTMVVGLAPNHIARLVIIISGITAGIFVTASSIAVIAHLKKNQTQLYTEEISSFEK